MTKRALWTTLGVAVLAFAGCKAQGPGQESLPTEADGEGFVRQKIAENPALRQFNVVSFKKTNGLKGERNGIATYQMEYEAEIEFISDGVFSPNSDDMTLRGYSQPRDERSVRVRKGERGKTGGTIQFEKAENGWRPRGDQL